MANDFLLKLQMLEDKSLMLAKSIDQLHGSDEIDFSKFMLEQNILEIIHIREQLTILKKARLGKVCSEKSFAAINYLAESRITLGFNEWEDFVGNLVSSVATRDHFLKLIEKTENTVNELENFYKIYHPKQYSNTYSYINTVNDLTTQKQNTDLEIKKAQQQLIADIAKIEGYCNEYLETSKKELVSILKSLTEDKLSTFCYADSELNTTDPQQKALQTLYLIKVECNNKVYNLNLSKLDQGAFDKTQLTLSASQENFFKKLNYIATYKALIVDLQFSAKTSANFTTYFSKMADLTENSEINKEFDFYLFKSFSILSPSKTLNQQIKHIIHKYVANKESGAELKHFRFLS